MAEQLEMQAEAAGPGKLAQVSGFLVATRTELEKVSWPSQPELINATKSVVLGALILGVVIGLMDFLLNKLLIDFVAYLSR